MGNTVSTIYSSAKFVADLAAQQNAKIHDLIGFALHMVSHFIW